jgi:arylsulfatase A-like enzyme/glucose/arabinose dehydrogenase
MRRHRRFGWFSKAIRVRRRPLKISRRLGFDALEPRRMLTAFDVLVFSETAGFRHDSIDEGLAAIQALGAANNFSVVHTEDSAFFTAANLAQFEAVVFLNATGDVLNATQQTAFESYIGAGGGFVGVHSAADTEYGWAWYGQLVGAYFGSHPPVRQATIEVADHVHASTAHLPDRWIRSDEWYSYNTNPRGDVHVLMTVDESTYVGGTMGFDHPIAWYHYFSGGRSWYTGLGHTAETYAEPLFLDHLLGGIQFAAGQAPADLGGTIDANWQKVELATGLNNPLALDIAPTGEVYFIELGGNLKIYNPTTGLTTVAGSIPVFRQGEDEMLAIALDPNFAQNSWIYLYFSPAGAAQVNRLSRFTVTNGALNVGSEQVMLTIPTTRVQTGQDDGHSGGSLAFGPDGVLYVSTGDDTVPFESGGYTPIDERPGRERFDAQRTSGNTNDLRGKILRIKPEADGSYSIPAGNLFAADATHRPEIYVMGNRNPFRISVDSETGWLYWGDIGPDAQDNSPSRGPRGHDEFNQARTAGNYGFPYVIADNKAYRDYNFATGASGPFFNPAAPQNNSPNNTGALNLPAARSALIWYPYAESSEFPEMGLGGRAAMAGPVYHFDPALASEIKLPEYFDDTLIIYDWSRSWFWEVKLDQNGDLLKINRIFSDLSFLKPIEGEIGPDGALYVIEWGSEFIDSPDSKLVRIEFSGNRPNLIGDYNESTVVDAADYVAWRKTLGASVPIFSGADGDGDGSIRPNDYGLWQTNYGDTIAQAGGAPAGTQEPHSPSLSAQNATDKDSTSARSLPISSSTNKGTFSRIERSASAVAIERPTAPLRSLVGQATFASHREPSNTRSIMLTDARVWPLRRTADFDFDRGALASESSCDDFVKCQKSLGETVDAVFSYFGFWLAKLPCVLPLLLIAAASAAPPNQNDERKPETPNILFIIADDQRWDTIRALGNPQISTPNLDALAKRGFVFRNAYCMGSMIGAVCTPSRTMLLTGRSLWRIPAWDSKTWTEPTLGSIFKEAGYDTLFVGKRGNSFVAAHEEFETVVYDEERMDAKNRAGSSQFHADTTINWLKDRDSSRPFLIYFAPPVPHDPRVAPAEFMKMYSAEKITLSKNFMPQHPFDNGELHVRDELLASHPRSEVDMKRHLAEYYATVSCLDHHFGRVLAALRESGQLDATLVIFTSDQGLAVGGRHGLMGKQNLYEHVKPPLILAGPGIPQGSSGALVYLFDLLPTLCDYSGLPIPEQAEGKSLLPVIEGQEPKVREWLFGAYRECQRMVRDDRWKLIAYDASGERNTQLFDLAHDPDEIMNLADDPKHAEQRSRLEKLLHEARKQFGDPVDFGKGK